MTDGSPALAEIHALNPARVLLFARDPRFLKIASFLLARRGFPVDTASTESKLMEQADQGAVDVVVLDASKSVSAAAKIAVALGALHPQVRVLLLTEDASGGLESTYRLLNKWRGLGALPDEVERAFLGLNGDRPAEAEAE